LEIIDRVICDAGEKRCFVRYPIRCLVAVAVVAILATSCVVNRPLVVKNSALDFLYAGSEAGASPPSDVRLELPLRVGIAFAPSVAGIRDPFTELQKQDLLSRIRDAFDKSEFVQSIEVIPTTYLSLGGGFENLDRLRVAFGVDLIGLVSYDQRQFTESSGSSWTYLTVIGAYLVKGEKNETRTVMDAVIYDIPSRSLLFRAAGSSASASSATPAGISRRLREDSEGGFETATDDLIVNLETALESFKGQVKNGSVRGPGTPAIEVVADPESGGAGAIGGLDLVAALALLVVARRSRKPSH
jgi:rhombotail lipoprotein